MFNLFDYFGPIGRRVTFGGWLLFMLGFTLAMLGILIWIYPKLLAIIVGGILILAGLITIFLGVILRRMCNVQENNFSFFRTFWRF
jgi:uncharacterized membrane protein